MNRYDPYTDKFLRDTQYDIPSTNLASLGTDCISRLAVIQIIEQMRARIGHNLERSVGRAMIEILDEVGRDVDRLPSALGTNLAEDGTDAISREQAIDALRDYLIDKRCPDDGTLTCRLIENEVINKLPSAQPEPIKINIEDFNKEDWERLKKEWRNAPITVLPVQPEIIRCKDCKYWVPGYITDNDDFIPPKCGEWQQMVGHSSDDYCSLAERREVTT